MTSVQVLNWAINTSIFESLFSYPFFFEAASLFDLSRPGGRSSSLTAYSSSSNSALSFKLM
ncbi:hypothetical protein HanRHA438_Chr11g0509311 [Helianthus annuus]|nr:hypothetical protein HanIR_Chr11g0534811 [Helianthus annuus]KAJ0871187.1 hypothetical protein HanRHA438_Chr11g0509311 [Helianthus annuus]